MRWVKNREGRVGSKREERVFLWRPLTLGNTTRWLETACIQYVRCHRVDGDGYGGWDVYFWDPIKFLD